MTLDYKDFMVSVLYTNKFRMDPRAHRTPRDSAASALPISPLSVSLSGS